MSIHEEDYKGYTIKIYHDEGAENPREWDNVGTMFCMHNRYTLGDDKHKTMYDFITSVLTEQQINRALKEYGYTKEERYDVYDCLHYLLYDRIDKEFLDCIIEEIDKIAVILPLYLYDHSGITMNTTGFSCPWDSGQVGFIYVTHENIKRERSLKRISKKAIRWAEKYLKCEVETYDQYLRGDVYGYVIEDESEETIDSCWGFFGDYDGYVLEQAKEFIDYMEK